MLTAAEIADMRSTVEDALPDTALVSRRTLTPDGYGGASDSWATVATVACRVSPDAFAGGERPIAGGEQAIAAWLITLPAETDVTATDRIVIGARTFEVIAVMARRTFELHTGVRCQEVT